MLKSDIVKKKHQTYEVRRFLQSAAVMNIPVQVITDENYIRSAIEILRVLRPSTAVGVEKIRLGGDRGGSYVMLDPGHGGIAYSLGVSRYSPWDLEMADRGFKVYQYDGSIEQQPDQHPNIFFNKLYVSSPKKLQPEYISMDQIIAGNNHLSEMDIILEIDVEGAEWDIFEHMTEEDIKRFKQIIVEFHDYHAFAYNYTILSKLRKTHTPIHVHYNNWAHPVYFPKEELLYNPKYVEVSYARNDDFEFVECTDFFPTPQDCVLNKKAPDPPIGYFDIITRV